jgi:hypothetical protein
LWLFSTFEQNRAMCHDEEPFQDIRIVDPLEALEETDENVQARREKDR